MFIRSQSTSFIRTNMTHAMVEAALKCNLETHKLAKKIGDAFVSQRATKVSDWTANIHTRKNIATVNALME